MNIKYVPTRDVIHEPVEDFVIHDIACVDIYIFRRVSLKGPGGRYTHCAKPPGESSATAEDLLAQPDSRPNYPANEIQFFWREQGRGPTRTGAGGSKRGAPRGVIRGVLFRVQVQRRFVFLTKNRPS